MRAVRVVEREGERVAERVVDVRLGREVHDGVDLLVLEDEVEEVGGLDVALDELRRGSGGGRGSIRGEERKEEGGRGLSVFFFKGESCRRRSGESDEPLLS